MRLTGSLRSWHDDRGFGFIAPSRGGRELFVHVSAFPQDGRRPLPGERLDFELGRGKDGKPQAVNVRRLAWAGGTAQAGRHPEQPRRSRLLGGLLRGLVLAVITLMLGGLAQRYFRQLAPPMPAAPHEALLEAPATLPWVRPADTPAAPAQQQAVPNRPPLPATVQRAAEAAPTARRCDGRTHCSQMTSCEEATYFLRNCPDTQMDGNHDGIPCEAQWCTGLPGR